MVRLFTVCAISLLFSLFGYSHGVQAQYFHWQVESINEDADTLTVGFKLSDIIPCCGDPDCPRECGTFLRVYPCPLDENCSENEHRDYNLRRTNDIWQTNYVKLLRGTQYEIWGYWWCYGKFDSGYECYRDVSSFLACEPKIFPEDYVATHETSWGAIKALFKQSSSN